MKKNIVVLALMLIASNSVFAANGPKCTVEGSYENAFAAVEMTEKQASTVPNAVVISDARFGINLMAVVDKTSGVVSKFVAQAYQSDASIASVMTGGNEMQVSVSKNGVQVSILNVKCSK